MSLDISPKMRSRTPEGMSEWIPSYTRKKALEIPVMEVQRKYTRNFKEKKMILLLDWDVWWIPGCKLY